MLLCAKPAHVAGGSPLYSSFGHARGYSKSGRLDCLHWETGKKSRLLFSGKMVLLWIQVLGFTTFIYGYKVA